MLKKLLRYDLKSVFKYWWIAAIASLGLSMAGGFCISVMTSEKDVPTLIAVLMVLTLIFSIIGIVAFSIISYILVYVRFYKNFFTDEGYLTFTLPVKRSQLLNSKLIASVLTMFCTATVIFVDIVIMFVIGMGESFYTELLKPMSQSFSELFSTFTASDIVYMWLAIILFLILMLLSSIFSTLFLFACITFASVITKKAKVITAIGIYYVANGFISGFVQILYMFGISAVGNWLTAIPQNMQDPIVTVMLLGVVLFVALICLLLYTLEYFMLDRKLNLS